MRATLLAVVATIGALAGCFATEPSESTAFDLALVPAALPYAFAGEPLVLLVNLTGDAGDPVEVAVRAPGAAVGVHPERTSVPGVVEITIVPDVSEVGATLNVTISATRGDEAQDASLAFEVVDPMTPPAERAAEVREAFAAWLEQERPELGIAPGQAWVGAFARPNILVVSYFVFYSDDWEMGVRWHVMIPPYDWAEIYLRPRFDATAPTMQWKVDSFSAEPWPEPYEVTPEPVWR